MSILKSIVGTVAVIFSIQPLATWAAQSPSADTQKGLSKNIQIQIKSIPVEGDSESGGNPNCHSC
jgi:hypothetical protein